MSKSKIDAKTRSAPGGEARKLSPTGDDLPLLTQHVGDKRGQSLDLLGVPSVESSPLLRDERLRLPTAEPLRNDQLRLGHSNNKPNDLVALERRIGVVNGGRPNITNDSYEMRPARSRSVLHCRNFSVNSDTHANLLSGSFHDPQEPDLKTNTDLRTAYPQR